MFVVVLLIFVYNWIELLFYVIFFFIEFRSYDIDLFRIVTNVLSVCLLPGSREHQRLCNLFPLHPSN